MFRWPPGSSARHTTAPPTTPKKTRSFTRQPEASFTHHRKSLLPTVILSEGRRQPNGVEGPHFRLPAKQAPRGIFTTDPRYWTYIIASRTGTLYIGITNNIERRVWGA
jgi:hypothetical protein